MVRIGPRTRNLLLGTATPIQTEVYELWDLLRILNSGADFVLGREPFAKWSDWERALPAVKGDETPVDERDAWEWLRNPLPPGSEDVLFATLRLQLGLADQAFFTDRGFGSLGFLEQQALGQALAPGFLREHNPIVRHTVLRRRQTLEDAGLLEKVGVDIHPDPDAPATAYTGVGFSGLGLRTNHPFDLAYQLAEAFTDALQERTKAAGFMKTLLLQRICSSFASGRSTAEKMLRREVLEDEEQAKQIEEALSTLTPDEAGHLRTIFGGLPDTIEDEWIETVETLEEMMDEYIHLRKKARDVFEMRYQETIDPDRDRWELCSRVLARRDVVDRLSIPW